MEVYWQSGRILREKPMWVIPVWPAVLCGKR